MKKYFREIIYDLNGITTLIGCK